MLSNAPEPNSIQGSNREAFRDRNANILRKLVAFVTLSQGLTIGFAASPSPRETDLLIDFFADDRDCLDLNFIILDFPDPQLHFLLEAIVPKLESLPNNSKPRVVVIRGLEHSIGVLGEYPPVLVDLNFTRDAYRRRVPYPILFVLPDYAITRIARFAPDFWAWKSVEFQLQSIYAGEVIPIFESVPEFPLERNDLPVTQERFDLLNRLLIDYSQPSLTRADLLLQHSNAFTSHSHYLEAKIDALGALELYQSFNRPMDEVNALESLSEIAYFSGAYQEAAQYSQTALEIGEQQLGVNHPNVASSLNNLANIYKTQGRYYEAEPLYLRSLKIRENQLGAEDIEVSSNLNNLAELYRSQGRYREAEPLLLRSLKIVERQFGMDHSNLAIILKNLAGVYRSQGRYSEAEPLYLRSLKIGEYHFGINHQKVASILNGLGYFYILQERYNEAEPLLLRSLEIREKKLGSHHPRIALTLNHLAYLRQAQGRYLEAKELWQRALKIWQPTLGNEHPHIQNVLKALTSLETILSINR
jgi:tetratricopeptide (TPR) repeat protein